MDPSSVKRRLTCILAADAVGYSKQMGEDEEGTIRVLSAHRAVIDGIITFHQGRIVSTAGDSVLAEFASAVEAVRCAVEIQEALKTRNDSLPEHRQMHFRVGVNLGDVVVKNDDLLGDGVNVAARLETMAEPGGICISSSVYDQITGKLDLGFQDIGEQTLKNISRPIHVYRVSGAATPVRAATSPPPARPAPSARNPVPWAIGAVVAAVIGAAVAWQGGWLRFGSPEGASTTSAAAPAVAPPPAASRGKKGFAGQCRRRQCDAHGGRVRSTASAFRGRGHQAASRGRAGARTLGRGGQPGGQDEGGGRRDGGAIARAGRSRRGPDSRRCRSGRGAHQERGRGGCACGRDPDRQGQRGPAGGRRQGPQRRCRRIGDARFGHNSRALPAAPVASTARGTSPSSVRSTRTALPDTR